MFFSVLLENSLLKKFLEACKFASDVYIQVSIQAQSFRNSKLVNVYSLTCFTCIG